MYGKEGTLFVNLDAKKLQLGLKSEGGQLKDVIVAEDKKEAWKVNSVRSMYAASYLTDCKLKPL